MALIDDNLLFAQEFEEDFNWVLTLEKQANLDNDEDAQELLTLAATDVEFPIGDVLLEEDESGIIGSFTSKLQIPDITATIYSNRTLVEENFLTVWSNGLYSAEGAYNSRNTRILRIYRDDRKSGEFNTDTQRFPTQKIHIFRVLLTNAPTFIGSSEGGALRTIQLAMKAVERI